MLVTPQNVRYICWHRKSGKKRTLLAEGTLNLGGLADTDEAVAGLKLLHGLGRVVDESEASGLAATILGAQAEDVDLVLLGLVQATELLTELLLGDVGTAGVENVPVHTIPGQQNMF